MPEPIVLLYALIVLFVKSALIEFIVESARLCKIPLAYGVKLALPVPVRVLLSNMPSIEPITPPAAFKITPPLAELPFNALFENFEFIVSIVPALLCITPPCAIPLSEIALLPAKSPFIEPIAPVLEIAPP